MRFLAPLATTLLGLVLAATPVALWVAWTPALLGAVLLTSLVCAALVVLLTEPAPEQGTTELAGAARVPEAFVEEVQGLFPMIYHHSGRKSSRFHRTMEKVSQLIER